ncbi:MAG TPA: porin family protein, partial [Salinimicrobium sp.]|nr:porin family protein [Salinimicrobium sp.]
KMKKVLLIAAIAVFGFTGANAQDVAFGAKLGFNSESFKMEAGGVEATGSETGFFLGLVAEIGLSESFALQPEVLYSSVSDLSAIYVPIMAKYYVASGFNVQAGPQINYILEEMGDDYSALGVDLAIGAGYDITDAIFVDARYGFEITNRYTGEGDASAKYNSLMVGVGYKF